MDAIGRAATARAERPRHEQSAYHLKHPPEGVVAFQPGRDRGPTPDNPKWSSSLPMPEIGARVNVFDMRKGPGVVTGYFVEHGWAGLHVRLDKPIVIGGKSLAEVHVFGIDLEPSGGRVLPNDPLEYPDGSGRRYGQLPRRGPGACDICGLSLAAFATMSSAKVSVHTDCLRRAMITITRLADACGQPDEIWAQRVLSCRIRDDEDAVEISPQAVAMAASPLALPLPSECSEVATRDPVVVLGPGGDFRKVYGAVDSAERDRLRGIITTGVEGGEG